MRRKYRSQAGIIADILLALYNEGVVNITRLTYLANLPYDRLKNILERLEKGGYVEIKKSGGEIYVKITENGLKLLNELEWIKKVFNRLGFKL